MRRDSKLVRGLVDWLLGGVTSRMEFLEQDVKELRHEQKRLDQDQHTIARTVLTHQQQLQHQAQQMIAMRKMHMLLADKVNREFPGQKCQACGSPLLFRRETDRNAYSLRCPNGCGDTLLLPEELLLKSLKKLLPPAN